MNFILVRLTVFSAALAALLVSGTTTSAQRANARIEHVNGLVGLYRERGGNSRKSRAGEHRGCNRVLWAGD